MVIPIVEERGWTTIFVPATGPDALSDFKASYPDEKYTGNILYSKFSDIHSILRVEEIEVFCLNGSLLLGSLLPVILEGHVWASIESERVL